MTLAWERLVCLSQLGRLLLALSASPTLTPVGLGPEVEADGYTCT